MSEQEKRVQRRKQEDAAFNKMLIWLGGCLLLGLLTVLLYQVYINVSLGIYTTAALEAFFNVYRFLGAVLAVAALVWLVRSARQGKAGKELALPTVCAGVLLWLWLLSALFWGYNEVGAALMCVLPAVAAGLSAIFFLYQREFFCNAVIGCVGVIALWVYRQIYLYHPRMTYCGFAAVWVFLALCAWAALLLQKRQGMALGLRILPVKANYPLIWLTCAVSAVALIAALALGVASAYYVMFALIGWLFCLAVYYTVKLM